MKLATSSPHSPRTAPPEPGPSTLCVDGSVQRQGHRHSRPRRRQVGHSQENDQLQALPGSRSPRSGAYKARRGLRGV
jgi:hypothetical protein